LHMMVCLGKVHSFSTAAEVSTYGNEAQQTGWVRLTISKQSPASDKAAVAQEPLPKTLGLATAAD
jgi:hypothetical protein